MIQSIANIGLALDSAQMFNLGPGCWRLIIDHIASGIFKNVIRVHVFWFSASSPSSDL